MEVHTTMIEGVLILEPKVFADDRGFFVETYNAARYEAASIPALFVQDNLSCSKKGALRVLHVQSPPFAQAKLVRVTRGSVFDVAVDIREGSPTFGKYVSVELSGENHRQFFIPAGFAHGFMALEDDTLFQYKCTNVYAPDHDGGIRYDDPDIGIAWPSIPPLVSAKDLLHPYLSDAPSVFSFDTPSL